MNKDASKAKNDMARLYNRDTLENEIIERMQEYASNPENEIDGKIADVSQGQFDGFLEYVGRALIIPSGVCFMDNKRNGYNIIFLDMLSDIYITLCNKYNKVPSFVGFSYMSGINENNFKQWALLKVNTNFIYNDCYIYDYEYIANNGGLSGEEVTPIKAHIAQKIQGRRENGIKNKLISNTNIVGAVAVANREYGWSAQQIAQETKARALSLQELPKLMLTAENKNMLSDDKETL